jgi:hypothetical protein
LCGQAAGVDFSRPDQSGAGATEIAGTTSIKVRANLIRTGIFDEARVKAQQFGATGAPPSLVYAIFADRCLSKRQNMSDIRAVALRMTHKNCANQFKLEKRPERCRQAAPCHAYQPICRTSASGATSLKFLGSIDPA